MAAALATQAQFTCTTNDGAITITGYAGPGGAVAIPSAINGLPVTDIGPKAFSGCSTLQNITIPGTVTNIGDSAFYQCNNLTSLAIPGSVTAIGARAFGDCFRLKGVTLGPSIVRIGEEPFSFCPQMKAIDVAPGNPAYSSVAGVLFTRDQTTLVEFPAGIAGIYTVPAGVATIGAGASDSCSLWGVTLPPGLTDIESNAFSGCALTNNLSIPDTVTNLGDYAFSGSALVSVTIGRGVTKLGDTVFLDCPLAAINVAPGNPVYSSVGGVLFNHDQSTLVEFPAGITGHYTLTLHKNDPFCDQWEHSLGLRWLAWPVPRQARAASGQPQSATTARNDQWKELGRRRKATPARTLALQPGL